MNTLESLSPADEALAHCLARLAQLQHESVDRLALQDAVVTSAHASNARARLQRISKLLHCGNPEWLPQADAARVPALLHLTTGAHAGEWVILRGRNGQQQWVSECWDAENQRWVERTEPPPDAGEVAVIKLARPFAPGRSPVFRLIRDEILSHRKLLRDALLGGFIINAVALAVSFYSMQVYDRVVPTGSGQTLLALTLGVFAAVSFELLTRRVRAGLFQRLTDQVDQRLARMVYQRFLEIRLDQMPQSVGALAAQLRGYETVRSFFTSALGGALIDAPYVLLFILVIALIAGKIAVIPLLLLLFALGAGWYHYNGIMRCMNQADAANNLKSGLLVETVEGAEIIKSGQGGWRMLSRWMNTTDSARDNELRARFVSEQTQHLTQYLQQLSYVLVVATGALLISQGELSMGGLIACSILSGRVLGPIATIPAQLVAWAQTRSALEGLDRIWSLQDDHHGHEQPVVVENLRGHYRLENVAMQYGDTTVLSVDKLEIRAGEKIGVLGAIGAGKTSFLRVLSGMYKPQQGRVLLDDVDLAHIAKPALAERMGYVPQDGRLFSGTLRDNLILGMIDPGDERILEAARQTGLLASAIAPHPKGLHQPIHEGGSGLSGGQRQLLNLTRVFLRHPRIWLLDEPTASMDRATEQHIARLLKQGFRAEDTVILATHKLDMLELVDRLIVIANRRVVLDGPRDQVLQRLQNQNATPAPTA